MKHRDRQKNILPPLALDIFDFLMPGWKGGMGALKKVPSFLDSSVPRMVLVMGGGKCVFSGFK